MKIKHFLLKLLIPASILLSASLIFFNFRTEYYGIMIKSLPIQNFQLQDQDGRIFDNSALKGRYSFVFFGFLRCASSCPAAMNSLHRLSSKISDTNVQFLYISIDSERDSRQNMKSYISSFGDRFTALYGDENSVRKTASMFNVSYEKELLFSLKQNYQLHHTGSVFLVGPDGSLRFIYPYQNLLPEKMAEDYYMLLRSL